jgi:hypothetical protein
VIVIAHGRGRNETDPVNRRPPLSQALIVRKYRFDVSRPRSIDAVVLVWSSSKRAAPRGGDKVHIGNLFVPRIIAAYRVCGCVGDSRIQNDELTILMPTSFQPYPCHSSVPT